MGWEIGAPGGQAHNICLTIEWAKIHKMTVSPPTICHYLQSGTIWSLAPRLVKEKEELKDWLARQKMIHQVFIRMLMMFMMMYQLSMVLFLMIMMIHQWCSWQLWILWNWIPNKSISFLSNASPKKVSCFIHNTTKKKSIFPPIYDKLSQEDLAKIRLKHEQELLNPDEKRVNRWWRKGWLWWGCWGCWWG